MRGAWSSVLSVLVACATVASTGRAESTGERCLPIPDSLQNQIKLHCDVQGVQVTLTSEPGSYLRVQCEEDGASVQWAQFPALGPLVGAVHPSASYERCAPPDTTYAAALRALGVRTDDLLTLYLERVPLSRRLLAGLPALRALTVRRPPHSPPFTLPADLLADLPALRNLTVQGAALALPPAPATFAGAAGLEKLEVSDGTLPELPTAAFRPLTALKRLFLWGDGIATVAEGALDGLTALEELDLSSNALRALPADAFRAMRSLRRLALFGNAIEALPAGLFAGLERLEEVRLTDNDAPLSLAAGQFASLPSLRALRLERCGLAAVPPDLLAGSVALHDLSLAGNALRVLPPALLRDQERLRTLDLADNALEAVGSEHFSALSRLEELILDGNRLELFPESMCSGLRSLQVLSARDAGLARVASSALSGARSLHTLRLDHNRLTLRDAATATTAATGTLDYLDYDLGSQSPLSDLLHLQHIDLSHNRISEIFYDWRTTFLHLKRLDLSYNVIEAVTYTDVNFLSENVTVDLRHNNITSLDLSPPAGAGEGDEEGVGGPNALLQVDDNPLECSCSVYRALQVVVGAADTPAPLRRLRVSAAGARCHSPPSLRDTPLPAVHPSRLTCPVSVPTCPAACQCLVRPAHDALEAHCAAWPTSPFPPPPPRRLRLHVYGPPPSPTHLRASLASLPSHTEKLSLSELNMTELSVPRLPTALQSVNLSDNKLFRLDEVSLRHLLSDGRRVDLSGNALRCECDDVSVLALLQQHSEQLWGYAALRCAGGGAVAAAAAARLCGVGAAPAVAAVACVLALAAAATALYYRNRRTVRSLLYSRGWCLCCVPDDDDDDDGDEDEKCYDAFVAHSHADEPFVVQQLCARLEAGPRPLRLCLHFRDWRLGEAIPAQIAASVRRSRRTVVVVSPEFLRSEWGLLEFRTAHRSQLAQRRARLVLVLLGELPPRLEPELEAYLRSNTYVRWGDPWFWEKLQYALRPGRRARAARTAADTMAPAALRLQFCDRLPPPATAIDTQLTNDNKIVNASSKSPTTGTPHIK